MEIEKPWWLSAAVLLFLCFGGYQTYLQQKALFTFEDAQTMAAKLEIFGAESPKRFADLNDKVAADFGIISGYGGGLDRSNIHFAPAQVNGVAGAAYMITVQGLNKRDCLDLEPNVLFASVQVNERLIDRSNMALDEIQALCHSTFWPWAAKNTVILTGA